jgi:hypothetical protein
LPEKYKEYKRPVFLLELALYGHPDSGGHWEKLCEKVLLGLGWVKVAKTSWRSVFWHTKQKCFLVVYVDDFRMAGPDKAVKALFKEIAEQLVISTPELSGKFLGCDCTTVKNTFPAGETPGSITQISNCRVRR